MNRKILFLLLITGFTVGSCTKNKESLAQNNLKEQDQSLNPKDDKASGITDESVMELKEDTYDFKEIEKYEVVKGIKRGKEVSHVFYFTNKGKKPLIISEVRPSCGCTTPKYTKDPVAPGKKGAITVTFDPFNFEGTVLKTVTISGNFPTKVIKFQAKIIN